MAHSVRIPDEVLWNVYGVTGEMIRADPVAAAIVATSACPKCGYMHGAKPCDPERDRSKFGEDVVIPIVR